MKNFGLYLIIAFCLGSFQPSIAQNAESIFEEYISQGLENNLALKQKTIGYNQSLQALKSARGYFYPSVDLNARYTRAHGGRAVEIPVSDAIDPVYKSLNEILTLLGQDAPFPESIENPEFTFFREKEHETKVRVSQPIFHPETFYNSKIKNDQVAVEKATMETYKRQLVEDIKTSYFQHAMAREAMNIFESAKGLLETNKRVTESLIRNDKITREALYRIEAELLSVESELATTKKDIEVSAAYFNFLLNRPLDSEIQIAQPDSNVLQQSGSAEVSSVIENREETAQLKAAQRAAQNHINLKKAGYLPTLSGAFDYGFQGETYAFSKDDDFWMASLVLNWNLFSGFQKKAETRQTKLALQQLETQQEELLLNLELQLKEAELEVNSRIKHMEAALAKIRFAEKNYKLTEKKYQQNMVSHIELIDAQNTLTQANIERSLAHYEILTALAHYERVAALYEF